MQDALTWKGAIEVTVDMFLKLDGIEGEAKDKDHKNEIDVLAWSWGMSNMGTFHTGGGGGTGKVNFQDISITKYVDKASEVLKNRCATGKHINTGKLVVRKSGDEKPLEYIVMEFEKIMVTSIALGGGSGEEQLTESVSLNFAVVKTQYTVQDDKGTGAQPSNFGWNIEEHVKL